MTRNTIPLIFLIALIAACAEDGIGPIDEDPVDFPCEGNRRPYMESIPDTFVSVGDTVWLQAVAYDPDGDELEYYSFCTRLTWGEIKEGRGPRERNAGSNPLLCGGNRESHACVRRCSESLCDAG